MRPCAWLVSAWCRTDNELCTLALGASSRAVRAIRARFAVVIFAAVPAVIAFAIRGYINVVVLIPIAKLEDARVFTN